MPPRDRSAAVVAREWLGGNGPETVFVGDLARLIEADRRAERARVRRIVRRERAYYTGPDHMVSGQVACDRILAALREGKGTR